VLIADEAGEIAREAAALLGRPQEPMGRGHE
jgi:hypothetical protein